MKITEGAKIEDQHFVVGNKETSVLLHTLPELLAYAEQRIGKGEEIGCFMVTTHNITEFVKKNLTGVA